MIAASKVVRQGNGSYDYKTCLINEDDISVITECDRYSTGGDYEIVIKSGEKFVVVLAANAKKKLGLML